MSKGQIALLPQDAKHHETLMDFLDYCHQHPDYRFWQALRNWSRYDEVSAREQGGVRDTFFWEGKRHDGM
jgi:hypothetical protein